MQLITAIMGTLAQHPSESVEAGRRGDCGLGNRLSIAHAGVRTFRAAVD